VLTRTVRFDEAVDVPPATDALSVLVLECRYSWWGRLRKLAFRPSPVMLVVELADGSEVRRRIIPGMAAAGFLLDPYLESTADVIELSAGAEARAVRRFRLSTTAHGAREFQSPLGVRLVSWPRAVRRPEPGVRSALLAARYPMFPTPPLTVRSAVGVSRERLDGEEVLQVHAPGEMRFRVPAGTHRVTGRFGVRREACAPGHTDGVQFRVVREGPGTARAVLLDRLLVPCARAEDAGLQPLDVTFAVAAPATLVLETAPGPAADGAWDWSVWSAIAIAPG
jgi:hypothetical protein